MKITFNSPVILTYALVCVVVHLLTGPDSLGMYGARLFAVGGSMDFWNPIDYFRLFSHIVGHGSWDHLVGNFLFILAIGPMIEEKYGWQPLLAMIAITALVTGLLNVIFLSTGLHGASGIVFMLILLGSFTNIDGKNVIPITFLLILVLYVGKEVLNMFDSRHANVSQFAHIVGGLCGGVFGYLHAQSKK